MTEEWRRRGTLLLNLHTSANFMAALLRRELERDGVPSEGFGLLTEIQLAGPITPSELSARTGLAPATIYDYTRQLTKRGHLERRANARDGRSYFLATTEPGREVVLRGGLAVSRVVEALQPHAERSLEELENALADLRGSLEAAMARQRRGVDA